MTIQNKLTKELSDLEQKMDRLRYVLQKQGIVDTLPTTQRNLMHHQLDSMKAYAHILRLRLKEFV